MRNGCRPTGAGRNPDQTRGPQLYFLFGKVQEGVRGFALKTPSKEAGGRRRQQFGGESVIPRIIDFSARNRLLVLTVVFSAAIYGWWSLKHVALDAIPDLS